MLFGSYRFHCRFESEAHLPPYKGSTFRGVFGRALKEVVCASPKSNCADCLVKEQCLYVLVFETGLTQNLPSNQRLAAPPHPFVLQPPPEETEHYPPGASFDFNLLLFGPVNRHLPYFIYAFDKIGRIGVGRRINGRRGQFVLQSVHFNERMVYDHKEGKLQSIAPLPHLNVSPEPSRQDIQAMQITLQTPLRIKYHNKLNPELTFHQLVRALLRRISSLMTCYDGGEPDLDYRGLVQRAMSIETVRSDLRWEDWRRYSFRQKQEMTLGGLIGTVQYQGDLTEFWPLIRFGERTHIGKQTAFGLGQIEARIE